MVGAMVKNAGWDAEVAGNIGPAVLDALMQRQDSGKLPQAWVLELSSFQLETTHSLYADAAAVLNLSEDHFDRYAGMAGLCRGQGKNISCKANGGSSPPAECRFSIATIRRVREMALAGKKQITFGLDPARRRE